MVKGPFFCGRPLWNPLPMYLKLSPTVDDFKSIEMANFCNVELLLNFGELCVEFLSLWFDTVSQWQLF